MKENEKLSLVDLGKKLLEASRKGQSEEVSGLMQSGAPFTTDWLGTSPLHLAAQHGHTKTAEVLLRAGVSRDARTKVDRTPLHMAAQNGHLSIIELLISSGACVNNRDMLNMTPLHWACEHSNLEIIKALLQAGAQTDVISKFGKTPLDIARLKCGNDEIALLSSGQDEVGDTKTSCSAPKRQVERLNLTVNSMKKRQRTKKFPMTAGSWTGNDGPPVIGGKGRRRTTTPGTLSLNSTMSNGRRLSAPTQFPNAGSPSMRSPTENSIASLVSAAELVKSKSEVSSGGPVTLVSTTAQDASVLDTLATLATATLNHNTGPTPSSSTQQVTTTSGRTVNVTPLTLPPNTPTSAYSGLTTPLTPSSLFQMPSPLAALSALSSQTSPLPNIAMSPLAFPMPINIGGQQLMMSGSQLVSSLIQHGTIPIAPVANTTDSSSTTASSSSITMATSDGTTLTSGLTATPVSFAQAVLPQQFLAYAGGMGQGQLPQGTTFVTQIPPGMLLDLNAAAAANKDSAGLKVEGETSKSQESAVAKAEDTPTQGSQEVLVTLQMPPNVHGIPSHMIPEHGFTLQPVQIIQQTGGSQEQGLIVQQGTSQPDASQDQPSTSSAQVVQLQVPAGITAGQLFQIPGSAEQMTMAQLQQNLLAGQLGSPLHQLSAQSTQTTQGSQQRLPQQQHISQQLLQQSIPQGLLQQNYVTQLGQVPLQAGVDLQQQQIQGALPQQIFFQVHEDYRKMMEHRQAEEDRSRKELEEKLLALERDSNKYRTELERAQKAAETYKDQLEAEAKERARLLLLYESPKKDEDGEIGEPEESSTTTTVAECSVTKGEI